MSDFLELRKKYKSFDWEYYSSNYFEDQQKKLNLNKDDCWWHYLTIGMEKNYIFFDIKDKELRSAKSLDFDWEAYTINYDIDKNIYPTKYHIWWHYINIGEPANYLFFSVKKKFEMNKLKNNFDVAFYKEKYSYLGLPDNKLWWHYLNYGKKEGFLYFDKVDSLNTEIKKTHSLVSRNKFYQRGNPNLLLFFPTLTIHSKQIVYDHVLYNLTQSLTNSKLGYNIHCVKFDYLIKQIVLLEKNELDKLCKKNIISLEFKNKICLEFSENYFDKIKTNSSNLFLTTLNFFPTEIFKLRKLSEAISNYKKIAIYEPSSYLYYLNKESKLINGIMNFLSKFDIIFSSSPFSRNLLQDEFKDNKFRVPNILINVNVPNKFSLINQYSVNSKLTNYILIFSLLKEEEDIKYIISQCKLYGKEYPDVHFYLFINKYDNQPYSYQKIKFLMDSNFSFIEFTILSQYFDIIKNAKQIIIPKMGSPYLDSVRIASQFNNKIITKHTTNPNFIEEFQLQNIVCCEFNGNNLLSNLKNDQTKITIDFNNGYSWNDYLNEIQNKLDNKNFLVQSHLNEDYSSNKTIFIYFDLLFILTKFSLDLLNSLIKYLNKHTSCEIVPIEWKGKAFSLVEREKLELYGITEVENIDFKINFLDELQTGIILFTDIIRNKNLFISNYLLENDIKHIVYFPYCDMDNDSELLDSFIYNNLLSSYKVICSPLTNQILRKKIEVNKPSFGMPQIEVLDLPYSQVNISNRTYRPNHKPSKKIGIYNPKSNFLERCISALKSSHYQNLTLYLSVESEILNSLNTTGLNCIIEATDICFEKFVSHVDYLVIEEFDVDSEILRRQSLKNSCPVIWIKKNTIDAEYYKGCLINDDIKKIDFLSIWSDSDYQTLITEINQLHMESYEIVSTLLANHLINL